MNFTSLFQDSWNFMRNQRQFVLLFVVIFALFFAALLFIPNSSVPDDIQNLSQQEAVNALMQQSTQALSNPVELILPKAILLFISSCALLCIHQLAQRQPLNLAQSATLALRRFLGVAALDILSLLLIILGTINGITSIMQNQASPFALVLMIAGIFWFIRTCFASMSYLLGNTTFSKSIPMLLKLAVGRSGQLFFYCLVCYFILPYLSAMCQLLAINPLLSIIAAIILAFIQLFTLVFSYRFYTQFIQQSK